MDKLNDPKKGGLIFLGFLGFFFGQSFLLTGLPDIDMLIILSVIITLVGIAFIGCASLLKE